ncbi:hypothetical protein DL764_008468 [Monosporascus ibericus]|uniref:DNA polymerase n=1 Tax=Monosporascus ibericus TaxID=155417 RepID=A0A4Q4SZL6_9PEZI|nr:hypothetical protein DL764_008468 [Monosporascus ibericus]
MALKFPTIYLLPKGLDPGRMSELESQIPSLTYDINEAEVVLGKLSHPQRAKLELQIRNIATEDLLPSQPPDSADVNSGPPAKRRKVSESAAHDVVSSTAPDGETATDVSRPTPANPPNAAFIEQLKEIRTIRTLTDDKDGERAYGARAYSTAISTLAAYPYRISCVPEIERLPGCSTKIAGLWDEWRENGFIQEVEDAKTDEKLSVLKLFYDIWGVAATTAREFYSKGWRDIDDIVEYGWSSLTRVQQIGVKFYDEFKLKIPRAEVESIGQTILEHANKIHEGFHMVIVGGYRRGKNGSGDVDVVLSHPNPDCTLNFVLDIVASLEDSQYITHTLTLSTKNSERGQTPVAWKGEGRKAGTGFDTLDKALLVWQEPAWDRSSASASQKQKNPNPHRRVDIIISPWRTAGCAVLGWSGATTFQRDLRRYCKEKKQLKFDSSGIRSRANGRWVDVESDPDGPAPDLLTAEKRVFASLGLEWRPPEERCTDG